LWHTEAMTADELRQLLRGAAFRPFTVHTADGVFRIAQPEFAALSPCGDTLVVFHKKDSAFDILDVPLIARVEVHEKPANKASS